MKKTLAFLAAVTFAGSAQAQSPFSYEAGFLAGLTKYDDITKLNMGLALGGNVGTFLLRNISIDLSADFGPNKSDRSGRSLLINNNRADLILNFPISGKWKGMIGGGVTGTQFRGDVAKDEYDSGLNGLIGLRYCTNENWSWTTSLIGDYKDPADQAPPFSISRAFSVRVGLVRAFGANRKNHPCTPRGEPLPAPPPPARQPAAQPPAQQPPAQPPAAQPPAQQPPPQRQQQAAPPPARQEPPPQPAAQPAPAPAPRPLMTFRGALFDFDKADLTAVARDTVDALVRFMNANPNSNVIVTGYTDDRGTDEYNLKLGQRRADAVKAYAVSKGIAAGRITATSKGEADPETSNATDAGRARNRRVIAVEVRP